MCGIYGAVSAHSAPLERSDIVDRMGQRLRHRGPDSRGLIRARQAVIGVERLRIVDPRPRGDQPFVDATARVVLACNGEIYNATSLRDRYPDYPYQSHSDIEPVLPLLLDRGPSGLAALEGMFALAVWDARARRLILARDRAGEKPLFYARIGQEIWFASEIPALLEHPSVARDIDQASLEEFLTLGYVREPRTMFPQVRKIEAGTIVAFTECRPVIDRYWHTERVCAASPSLPEAKERLEGLLSDAVAQQTVPDAPMGVFASGGVDSSMLAALAARLISRGRLYTFTVGFEDPRYDERPQAAAVARHLGTRHIEVTADGHALREALDVITDRVAEPVADPALLPTYLLARAAREHVAVVLGGEGADELFGGYPTYLGHKVAPRYLMLPAMVRRVLGATVNALPAVWGKVPLEYLLKRFVAAAGREWPERHLDWFGTGLDSGASPCCARAPAREPQVVRNADPVTEAMRFDFRTYLRDDLLTKVDRATMLASLEARAPYLDRRLVEFALCLEPSLKVRGLTTKWLLKEVARDWLPPKVIKRRKRGLSVPIGTWINNGLRSDVDRLLAPHRLRRDGVLRPARVQQLLVEHRSGRVNHARPLWAVITYQLWRERWLGE